MNDREAVNRVLDLLLLEMLRRQEEQDEAARSYRYAPAGHKLLNRREMQYHNLRASDARLAQGVLFELLEGLAPAPPVASDEEWESAFAGLGPNCN